MTRPLKCIGWGIFAIFLLGSPIILAWIAFKLLVVFVSSVSLRGQIAMLVGYIWLLFWPLYVLGSSLQRSREAPEPWPHNPAAANGLTHPEIIDVWKTCVDVQTTSMT